jgi:hypothetical protein
MMARKKAAQPEQVPEPEKVVEYGPKREIIERLCEAYARLGVGTYACAEVGVPHSTLMGWLARREQGHNYGLLAERWEEAKVRARARLAQHVIDRSAEDWRAAAWLLERLDPQTWPQKPEVVVTTHVHQGADVAGLLAKLVPTDKRVGSD